MEEAPQGNQSDWWTQYWVDFDRALSQNSFQHQLTTHYELMRQRGYSDSQYLNLIDKIHFIAHHSTVLLNGNEQYYKQKFRQYYESDSTAINTEHQRLVNVLAQNNQPRPPHAHNWTPQPGRPLPSTPLVEPTVQLNDNDWAQYWQIYDANIQHYPSHHPQYNEGVILAHKRAFDRFSPGVPLDDQLLKNLIKLANTLARDFQSDGYKNQFKTLYEDKDYYLRQLNGTPSAPTVTNSNTALPSHLLPECIQAYVTLCTSQNIPHGWAPGKENTLYQAWPEGKDAEGKNKGTPVNISEKGMSLDMPTDQRFEGGDPEKGLSEQAKKSLTFMAEAVIAATEAYIETNKDNLNDDQKRSLRTAWATGDNASVKYLKDHYESKGYQFGDRPDQKNTLENNDENAMRVMPRAKL